MPDNASEDPIVTDGDASSDPQPGARPRRPQGQQRSFLKELPILLVVALFLSFVIQTFLARVYVIPSESMEPTLLGCTGCEITNDRIVVDKVGYRFSEPRPGDVVVFKGPDSWSSEFTTIRSGNVVVRGLQELGSVVGLAPPDERDFVKRIVATGGQTVVCCDATGNVQVDGVSLSEPYIRNDFPFVPGSQDCDTVLQSARCFAPVTVPEGNVWVMGDNRDDSADSRAHVGDDARGTVPVDNVIGKARIIVVPVSRWQTIDSPEINPAPAAALPVEGGVPAAPALLAVLVATPVLGGRLLDPAAHHGRRTGSRRRR